MSIAWEGDGDRQWDYASDDFATEERQERLWRAQHKTLVTSVWLGVIAWCGVCWWTLGWVILRALR